MYKKYISIVLIPIVLFFYFSCQQTEKQNANQQSTHQSKSYSRIISLSPSTTEILFALGLGEQVVGVTRFCKYPVEAQEKTDVGGYLDPNYEAIAMLKPDVVILLPEHENVKNYLDELEITYLIINNKTVADILSAIETIGKTCGRNAEAGKLTQNITSRLNIIRERTRSLPRPKVLVCIGRALETGALEDIYIAGHGTFYDHLIETAGGINAYQDSTIAYPLLSAEGIIHTNPDIIFDLIGNYERKEFNHEKILKDWYCVPGINAVKNNRIYILSQDYIFIPGPRFVNLLQDFVKLIHPEIEWND